MPKPAPHAKALEERLSAFPTDDVRAMLAAAFAGPVAQPLVIGWDLAEETGTGDSLEAKMKRTRAKGDAQEITVVFPGNPYKRNTKAARTFDLFRICRTVRAFKMAVALAPNDYDAGYLHYSSRDGYITLS